MTLTRGVDVSDYQGSIDWAAVAAAGIQFAFTKASEGVGFKPQTFDANWSGIKAAGLTRGAYHFARPSVNAADAEADYFLSVVGALEEGDLLMLDMEDTNASGNLDAWTREFLAHVVARVGFRPFLYSGHWYTEPHGLEGDAELGQYGLALSAYQPDFPASLPGWDFVAIWQSGSNGSIPGIPGAVDLDYFNGDLDHLKLYGAGASPVTPPAPTPAPAPPPPAPAPSGAVVVQPGDSLSAIAARHGWDLGAVEAANPQLGPDFNLIYPGQLVNPPAGAPVAAPATSGIYTVKPGDSLSAIAANYGITWRALWGLNQDRVPNPDLIYPGEVLRVP